MKRASEVAAKWEAALPPLRIGWEGKLKLRNTAQLAKDFERRARLEIADIRAILALREQK